MFLRVLLLVIILSPLVLILPRLVTNLQVRNLIYDNISKVPNKNVAIVFGAGLWRDGSPTPVLRDRVTTAAELFFAGKADVLLMSGDNQFVQYNEPGAMRDYALKLGVPNEAIVLDYAGRRTYDSCYRARDIFGVQEVILVTQRFHLPRALYTCTALGLSAVGVPADRRDYRPASKAFWNLREIPATFVAMWEVHFSHPQPVLGNPEPIFPMEAQ